MDFNEAIRAHAEWKLRLATYLRKPDGSLDPAMVAADDRCRLGAWLREEQAGHARLPEFTALKDAHARFHRAAADVIRRADAGDHVLEDVLLGAKSEYATASTEITRLLMTLRALVGRPGSPR